MKVNRPLKASVIVPSYNGATKLPELLRSIACQTIQEIEVIVVVDGSTDDTADVLQRYHKTIPNFRIVIQENGGRSIARNTGARNATSNLFIFYDDDVKPDPQSVEKHLSFHKKYFGITCGDAVEVYGNEKTDVQNYKAWLTAKWTDKYAKGITQMTFDGLFFTAANCSVPSATFW
jgi:glycosyltransferase involved in cell wall biosynthesis